ncbi:permease for cytosine/purines, uracil, thiamine, allantoin-domain-containing protein [Lentinula lateritia]|nr:permease for cytosine/purines, uracil, thiamine, allantoin-domain-containing protein [Lentinula lateritia]
MSDKKSDDPEKSFSHGPGVLDDVHGSSSSEGLSDDVPRSKFAKLWAIVEFLDKYGVEARGIERVPSDQHPLSAFWMWLAANMTIVTFSLGCLGGPVFSLSFKDAALTIIFFNLLCNLPVAYFSTWGPKLGLRQLTLSKFSFGYFTSQVPIILNCIACVGWSVVNSIVGAQTLRAVSTAHQIPTAAAIVVIAIGPIAISFMGYRVVHLYEQYAWIPITRFIESDFRSSGTIEIGNVLSFGATIAGSAIGWVSYAADYTVRMPEDMSSVKIFFWAYLGLNVPPILVEILHAAAMSTFNQKTTWADAYAENSVGGLLGAGLAGPMGGLEYTPIRSSYTPIFIVIIGSVVYIILAIAGASHFVEWLETMLDILAYWLAIFSAILIEEHLIFRRGKWSNYNPEDYNNWRKLPLGVASFIALSCGVAGAVLGMAQSWYIGIIGGMIGYPAFGGDIGFELAFVFSAIVYPPLRWIEKKYWGH